MSKQTYFTIQFLLCVGLLLTLYMLWDVLCNNDCLLFMA